MSLALVLFFSGLAPRFGTFYVRVTLLAVGLVLLGIGRINLFRDPMY